MFLSERPVRRQGFYGNGSCFMWRENTEADSLKVYMATAANSYYILAETGATSSSSISPPASQYASHSTRGASYLQNQEFLAFGAGDGTFGLWIDHQLLNGHSDTCPTFLNEPLSSSPNRNFQILALELWSFVI